MDRIIEYFAKLNFSSEDLTALQLACIDGKKEVVEHLIKYGEDVNKCNKTGNTALHYTAERGDLQLLEFLIENNADITICNGVGDSVLHYACKSDNVAMVTYLLDSGLQVDCVNYIQVTPIMRAAQCGRLKVVKFLRKRGSNSTSIDKEGNSVLHYACKSGNVTLVTYLLDSGLQIDCVNHEKVTPLMTAADCGKPDNKKSGNHISAVDIYGESVLHYACKSDNVALVTYLLDLGLQIDCVNCYLATPLMIAAQYGKLDIVKLLEIRGSNFAALDKYGDSVLHFACRSDNITLVTYLLDSGLHIDCANNVQETPLMRAAQCGNLHIFKLLETRGSSLTTLDKYGNSVLYFACISDNVALVTYLLDSGLQIDYMNNNQQTPVMQVAKYGKLDMVKFLQKRGSNVIAVDKCGESVLHYACRSNNVALVTYLLDSGLHIDCVNNERGTPLMRAAQLGKLDIVKLLVTRGANITALDKYANNVLHYACMSDNVSLITYLLDSGLQINSISNHQMTPLLIAACNGKSDIVRLLEARGSNSTVLSKYGDSVLHYACRSGNIALVAYLLDSGQQVNCVNNQQVTPLMNAAENGKLDIVKLLDTRGSNFTALDIYGDSVLHYACKSDNVALVTYLLDLGLQIDCVNCYQATPLMTAALCGNLDIVRLLETRGSNFTTSDIYGNNLLHDACRSDNVALVTYLLDSGLQIDCVNYEQVTPLITAALFGELEIVKLLETRGCNFTALDVYGDSVLHNACRSDNVALVTYLLDSGLQIDCVNYERGTPLTRAALFGKLDIVKLLEAKGSNFTVFNKYGDSVLHYACRSDNVALVTYLLDSGQQINCVNNEQVTPLMNAAENGKLDIVKLLETRGSNFTAVDKDGDSVLHFASWSDNVALVTHLLNSGLQIDCVNCYQATPLMRAAEHGKLDIVKLLQARGSNFTALDKYGDSVLHYACRSDNIALVTHLLDSGLKIDCVNYAQVNPVMKAAWNGKLDIVKLLQTRGSNFTTLDKGGDNVLHYACRSDNVALVTHLLDSGLQMDCLNYAQVTPLMRAAQYGKLVIVKLLETRGSNFTALDKNGDSVLHYACRSDNVLLDTSILVSELQIDSASYDRFNLIMGAIWNGKLDTVKLLQKRGSNFAALNIYGDSVLHYACRSDNIALVTHLLDSGLQIDCVNYKQETPLMTAAWNGKLDIVKLLEIRGSDLTALDKYGNSVLHYACRSSNIALVIYLLDSGLQIDCVNNEQVTPLMRAAKYGKLDIVKLLETRGSNLTALDKYGNSVLHYACRSDNIALVIYLLDSGLQIECVNNEQVTPLMRAAKYGKLDIVKLLEVRGSKLDGRHN